MTYIVYSDSVTSFCFRAGHFWHECGLDDQLLRWHSSIVDGFGLGISQHPPEKIPQLYSFGVDQNV